MSGEWIYWVIAAIVVVAIVVIVAVVASKKRGQRKAEPIPDPPYNRKKVPDPTEGDPQDIREADPADVRYPDGPDNVRNPHVDNKAPGPSTPDVFPPPGPPRE